MLKWWHSPQPPSLFSSWEPLDLEEIQRREAGDPQRTPAPAPGIGSSMADPYRDPDLRCPACPEARLRPFRGRLVCDACGGIQMPMSDLVEAIRDLTGIEPTLELVGEAAGTRACPHCRAAMTTCHVRVRIEDDTVKTKPTLDHCVEHGIWFDNEELALVLAKVRRKRSGGTAGGAGPVSGFSTVGFSGRGGPWWPGA